MKRIFVLVLAGALFAPMLLGPSFAAVRETLSPTDMGEIEASYQHLTQDFYRKVDDQAVLDGARAGILSVMTASGVKAPSLPKMHADSSDRVNLSAIDVAVETAQREAGGKVDERELSYGAISGMMNSVKDRYTVFLKPSDYSGLNQDLDGADFGGTGIVIQSDDPSKYISVSNVVPGGPADKAGIQQDDLIVAIDGLSTKGMTIDKASSHLRGKQGTNVTLTISRAGTTLAPIVITRAKIHQLSVFSKMLPGKIGYVALTVFGRDTGDELAAALARLQQEGMRAVIMDLRDNGGGYLEAAVAVSSEFIATGPIVSVESRASNITTREADDTAIAPVPHVVLVNGHTASASEITSGAIQDSAVGTIMGTRTFGKGVVQTVFPLGDGSAVKITTARYLTPHNRDINHLGIAPDVVVVENKAPRFGEPAKDVQLQRALQFVNDKLAHSEASAQPAGN